MKYDTKDEALLKRLIEYEEHVWYDSIGGKWYFEDETGDPTNGPFDSRAEAKDALWKYIDGFLQPKTEAST